LIRRTVIGVLFFSLLSITGCEESGDPIHPQAVAAELYSLGNDFRLWGLVLEQEIDNNEIKARVANLMIGRLIMISHADYEMTDLAIRPMESLCRATTDEARHIMENYGHSNVVEVALKYVDDMRPAIIEEFRSRQSEFAEGCFGSPRKVW
jgi:hypothetical protein